MASKHLTHEQQNFVRLTLAGVDEARVVLGYVLHSQILPKDLVKKIQGKKEILLKGEFKLNPEQQKLCYVPGPVVPDYKTFDITLLYKLIRNLCSSLQPSQGWGKEPRPTEINIGDDIERLRIFRNEVNAHANSSSVSDSVFKSKWNELENIFKRIQGFLRTQGNTINLVERLESIKRTDFGWQDKHETLILTLEGGEQKTCGESACFVVRLGNREIPHDWLITWHRIKGNITEQLDTSAERYKGSSSQRLVITKVSKEDEGEYRATVSREEKGAHIQIPSNTIYLTVTGESKISREQLEEYLQTGGKTTVRHALGVVVGCGRAGKTTLLQRLMGKNDNDIDNIESTRGVEIHEHIFVVKDEDLIVKDDTDSRKRLLGVSRHAFESNKKNAEPAGDYSTNIGNIRNRNDDPAENTDTPILKSEDSNEAVDRDTPILKSEDTQRTTSLYESEREAMEDILQTVQDETTVSMIDFAGQFAYYACHQIYLRPNAFFILVLNMKESFTENGGYCSDRKNDSNIYSTWTKEVVNLMKYTNPTEFPRTGELVISLFGLIKILKYLGKCCISELFAHCGRDKKEDTGQPIKHKKKEAFRKREGSKTGGGPCPEVFFKSWELMLLGTIPKEAIHGLEGGADTGTHNDNCSTVDNTPIDSYPGATGDCAVTAECVSECVVNIAADESSMPCTSTQESTFKRKFQGPVGRKNSECAVNIAADESSMPCTSTQESTLKRKFQGPVGRKNSEMDGLLELKKVRIEQEERKIMALERIAVALEGLHNKPNAASP